MTPGNSNNVPDSVHLAPEAAILHRRFSSVLDRLHNALPDASAYKPRPRSLLFDPTTSQHEVNPSALVQARYLWILARFKAALSCRPDVITTPGIHFTHRPKNK